MFRVFQIEKIVLNDFKIKFRVTTVIPVVVMLFFMVACTSKEETEKIAAIENRSALPKLHATEITTLISDSGVTRYRITAPQWDVYDKANRPYWDFPNGIHFEKFNLDLKVDADIHSKYARYFEYDQLWELKGQVKAMNLQGELFETEQLFWNQREERFYSDSIVKITQKTMIINAIGFESNQTMTKYTFRKTFGPMLISENDSTESSPVNPVPTSPNK